MENIFPRDSQIWLELQKGTLAVINRSGGIGLMQICQEQCFSMVTGVNERLSSQHGGGCLAEQAGLLDS